MPAHLTPCRMASGQVGWRVAGRDLAREVAGSRQKRVVMPHAGLQDRQGARPAKTTRPASAGTWQPAVPGRRIDPAPHTSGRGFVKTRNRDLPSTIRTTRR